MLRLLVLPFLPLGTVVEVEHVEQISNRRRVDRGVRVAGRRDRIRQVVTAPVRQRVQMPVALDELEHRCVVAIAVNDLAASAAALVEGDEDRGLAEEIRTLRFLHLPK